MFLIQWRSASGQRFFHARIRVGTFCIHGFVVEQRIPVGVGLWFRMFSADVIHRRRQRDASPLGFMGLLHRYNNSNNHTTPVVVLLSFVTGWYVQAVMDPIVLKSLCLECMHTKTTNKK